LKAFGFKEVPQSVLHVHLDTFYLLWDWEEHALAKHVLRVVRNALMTHHAPHVARDLSFIWAIAHRAWLIVMNASMKAPPSLALLARKALRATSGAIPLELANLACRIATLASLPPLVTTNCPGVCLAVLGTIFQMEIALRARLVVPVVRVSRLHHYLFLVSAQISRRTMASTTMRDWQAIAPTTSRMDRMFLFIGILIAMVKIRAQLRSLFNLILRADGSSMSTAPSLQFLMVSTMTEHAVMSHTQACAVM
jgi:hypothetical protein